jgi:hypothetical protein
MVTNSITNFCDTVNLDLLLRNHKGVTTNFKELLSDHEYLFFLYFNETACASCVQNQFKILQNHPRIVNNKNFKFIIGYRSQRAASVFLNSYGFSSNYLNLIDLKIGINTDMPHIPQYLFINKEGTVLFNYFCDESLNDLTESFLLTIEKRWFY